jgi:phosphoadenosine phosphosulfate reductase
MPGLTISPSFLPKTLQLPLTPEALAQINAYLNPLTPQEILQWALSHLPNLYQTTAFGMTGVVAIDMLSKLTSSPPPLIFFDTLYHFPETYKLVERVKERYGVAVDVWRPEGCDTREQFEERYGERLWERDQELYDFLVKVRKPMRDHSIVTSHSRAFQVEPAQRAYKAHGIQSLITGRRASQGGSRATLQPLEVDSTGMLKLNPLCSWNFHLVEWYKVTHDVPVNALLSQGYRSVGDWHSTQKTVEGEGERAGRWKGTEKTECGLHVDYFKMKDKIQSKVRDSLYL